MKKTACVSISIKDKPEVVVDQIENINHFYKNDVHIVLHEEQGNSLNKEKFGLRCDYSNLPNVYINPEHLSLVGFDTMPAHNSNFKFAKSNLDFDYFILHSDSDMYVKHGVVNYLKTQKNGIFQFEFPNNLPMGHYLNNFKNDLPLLKMMIHCDLEKILLSQYEGVFFEKNVFEKILEVIDQHYIFGEGGDVVRHQAYYSTLASKFAKIVTPPMTFNPSTNNEEKNVLYDTIDGMIEGREIGGFTLKYLGRYYDIRHLYATTNIPRYYDDDLRVHIRNLMK